MLCFREIQSVGTDIAFETSNAGYARDALHQKRENAHQIN
jgi:hypothetical protein